MSLQNELSAAWDVLVKKHGFRKSRGINTLPFGKDWQGWLGLNSATYGGAGPVDVIPVVGVHWKPLQQIYQELSPQLPKSTSATLSRPLSTLVEYPSDDGQWRERAAFNGGQWRVRGAKGEPFHLEETLEAVIRWGVPFMESLCDPEVVVNRLRPPTNFTANPAVAWKTFPIALVLTNRQAEAVEHVRKHLQDATEKQDLASQSYVEYAGRFLQKYS